MTCSHGLPPQTGSTVRSRDDDGRAVGFVHWLFHPRRGPRALRYLEDPSSPLPVVAAASDRRSSRTCATRHAAGAQKVYWLTQSGNRTARRLYDSLATDTGFVHYEMEL
jgi:hypothetical protein